MEKPDRFVAENQKPPTCITCRGQQPRTNWGEWLAKIVTCIYDLDSGVGYIPVEALGRTNRGDHGLELSS